MRTFLCGAIACLLVSGVAYGAVALPSTVEELARASQLVVHGRVLRVTARWSDDRRRIFSFAEIEPLATWRGVAGARVTVLTPGGVVGNLGQRVDGAAVFTAGEEIVVFLFEAERGLHRVTGLAQGKFVVERNLATPSLGDMMLVPRSLPAHERRSEPMGVAELERRVRSVR
jgi:hypothetical protein